MKTTDNLADAFTKASINKTLKQLMKTGLLNQSVLQWVIRKGKDAIKKTNTMRIIESTIEKNVNKFSSSKKEEEFSKLEIMEH